MTIIDGQQRLTTLTLIFFALYHSAYENEKTQIADEIKETYLTNKYVAKDNSKIKLKVTENNYEAIYSLLEGRDFERSSKIIENYDSFKKHIHSFNIEIVIKGISKLMFVEVALDRTYDDPQKIFESLNSTGVKLSSADLIRNYLLMGLDAQNQEDIYKNYWSEIERFTKEENENKIENFVRDYLTFYNKVIPTKKNIYGEFKETFEQKDFETLKMVLEPMKSLASFYHKILNPNEEEDVEIRKELKYIKQLQITVCYPFFDESL